MLSLLIADDDRDDHDLIKLAIKESRVDLACTSVYNGSELMDYLLKRKGYEKLLSGPPDLIILDLNMPLLNGFEVLVQMHLDEDLSTIPVYVLSTTRYATDIKKALDLGAKGFHSKPDSFPELKKIIEEVCDDCFNPH